MLKTDPAKFAKAVRVSCLRGTRTRMAFPKLAWRVLTTKVSVLLFCWSGSDLGTAVCDLDTVYVLSTESWKRSRTSFDRKTLLELPQQKWQVRHKMKTRVETEGWTTASSGDILMSKWNANYVAELDAILALRLKFSTLEVKANPPCWKWNITGTFSPKHIKCHIFHKRWRLSLRCFAFYSPTLEWRCLY